MLFGGHEQSPLAGIVEPIPGSCDSSRHISAPAVNRSAEAPLVGGNRAGRLTSSGYGLIALESGFGSIYLAENCIQTEKPLARYVFPSEPKIIMQNSKNQSTKNIRVASIGSRLDRFRVQNRSKIFSGLPANRIYRDLSQGMSPADAVFNVLRDI